MRNFSSIKLAAFNSYQVNDGEYKSIVPINMVLVEVARVLEVPLIKVRLQYHAIIREDIEWYLSPADIAVLKDLAQFDQLVRNCEHDYWAPTSRGTHVFTYCNLNTGNQVTWVHSVI